MPKYRQVREALRARIDRGEFPAGEKLPTRPQLAEDYQCSVGTIADAIRELADMGYVETRQGSGIYALTPPRQTLTVTERLERLEAAVFGERD